MLETRGEDLHCVSKAKLGEYAYRAVYDSAWWHELPFYLAAVSWVDESVTSAAAPLVRW